MNSTEARTFVNELFNNAVHKDAFFENVSTEDIIRDSKLDESDYDVIDNALHFIRQNAEEQQAICESADSDKVLEFRNILNFPVWFQEKFVNGDVWGVYYNDNNELVCQDRSGEVKEIE